MDKKYNSENINIRSNEFYEYLKIKLGTHDFNFLLSLSSISDLVIFSGIIRNFFLNIKEPIRDLDLVVNCDINKLDSFLVKYPYEMNSFGGYKIPLNSTHIDLWHIENTWALAKGKITPNLFSDYILPETAFFNFSAIIYDFNNKLFIASPHFFKFINHKEMDLVLEENPHPELCIVNTIYYSNKFRLKISPALKKYYISNFNLNNSFAYNSIQFKHFGKILFPYNYLKSFLTKFKQELEK